MTMLEELMIQVPADIDVLVNLDTQGDHFNVPRDVEFILYASSEQTGESAVGFINDYRFGNATLGCLKDGKQEIIITIHTPVTQDVILCLSGYMACLAKLFDLEYNGWGCVAQRMDN